MPVDYDALAKQAGALSSTPAPAAPNLGTAPSGPPSGAPVDYDALAKQAGAISSQPPNGSGPAASSATTASLDWKTIVPLARAEHTPDEQTLATAGQAEPQLQPAIDAAQASGRSAADILDELSSTGKVSAPSATSPDNSAFGKVSRFAGAFDERTLQNLNPVTVVKTLGHPLDTYAADSAQRAQILSHAEQDFHNGNYGSAAIHALDSFVPVLGPMINETGEAAASGDPERMGRAVANLASFKAAPEAYGLLGKGARALPGPAGRAAQAVSDLSTQTGQYAAGQAVDLLNKGADAASDATAGVRNAAAQTLNASAKKNIGTALNPTTKINKALTEDQIAPGLLDRKVVATSLQDLQDQARAKMAEYGQQIDDIFDREADAGTKLPVQPILDKLEAEKQRYTVDGVDLNPAYTNRLTALQEQLQSVSRANAGDLPLASLRRIRQVQDELVDQSKGGFALPPDAQSAVQAAKVYGNGIRSAFAENVPDLAAANREFNFWANTDRVVDATLQRKVGQRAPLTQKILEGVGTMAGAKLAGPAGALVGNKAGALLGKLQNSTLWNTLAANTKARIAGLIASGDEAGAIRLARSNGIVPDADAAESAAAPSLIKEVPDARETTDSTRTAPEVAAIPEPSGAGRSAGAAAPGGPAPGRADTTIRVPGQSGPGYRAVYKVRELGAIQPSHNGLTLRLNPKYQLVNDRNYATGVNQGKIVNWSSRAEFDPSFHLTDNPDATNGPLVTDAVGNVIGGNGRAMILQRVHAGNPEGAAAYRNLLLEKAAQFGLDPEAIARMKQPVLTREIPDSEFVNGRTKQQAVTDFNKKGTAELTPAERAIADSRRVSEGTLDDVAARLEAKGGDATLAQALEGQSGNEVLTHLIDDGVIAPQERAAFGDENGLNKAGKERIASLIAGRFFRDPAQLESIPASIRGKVERLAAPLAQVEGKGEWNLSPEVQAALDLLDQAHKLGIKNVDDFVKQDGLFGKDKYSPQTITLAKALQTAKPNELTAAARQYAQDAQYAGRGQSLLGDAPTPAQSFADSFGGLKSGAASDAARLSKGTKNIEAENSRPYDAPRLTDHRDEGFQAEETDLHHLGLARFERIPLGVEDAKNAVARVTNLNGMEYLGRMMGWMPDEAVFGMNAAHIAPQYLSVMIGNLKSDAADLSGARTAGLEQLAQAAQEARAAGKSLIVVKDHALLPGEQAAAALNEEVNHAAQRAATGPLRNHLRASASDFVGSSPGKRATQFLEGNLGYRFRSPGEAASEVGVRLMHTDQYRELGLTRAEASALAKEYVQRLEKEYGRAAVRSITRRVSDANR